MSVKVTSEGDIYQAVSVTSYLIKNCRFDASDKQSIFISVQEVLRNVLDHAGGEGLYHCELTDEGFRFVCTDKGPGIHNLDDVLQGTYKSEHGLGLGLASVKRLMDEVHITTSTEGTNIIASKRERRR